jgi:sulfide:quinone oxidoreductase
VFVSPAASGWALPIYELALMAALARPDADIAVVTAEPAPLWIFGVEAGEAIRELFLRRGIALLSGVRVLAATEGELELDGAESVSADCAVALPRLVGPAFPGLPNDEDGFIGVDAHGAVAGVADVYAAGDVTTFPLKQGGLATQQADAVAAAIAAALGAPVTPEPFQPVLRGLLLTGGAPLYLRSDGAHGTSRRLAHTAVSGSALWWPPAKVAGRYIARLLGTVDSAAEELSELLDAETPEPENAGELALTLAREDAAQGDYARALHALDTAEALADRELPAEWQRTRTLWQAQAKWSPS